ncbi:MAG: hypothetical protein OHK0029_10580 [Armatimonadaceae bacterium]
MPEPSYRFTVFTKPWITPLPELGKFVSALGFDGIELPVRPGYPVDPDNMAEELPRAARLLREEFGLRIESVAGPLTTEGIAACGEAGVPIIRICPRPRDGESYTEEETRLQREWESLVPVLEEHQVTIGVQNHSGRFIPVHAMGLARIVSPFDPRHVCSVWDTAHNALEGENVEFGLDLLHGPHLKMVNLKNAIRVWTTGPEAEDVGWKTYWTSGRQGFASWSQIASSLKAREWSGVICLTAEYSDPNSKDRLIAEDIRYARSLFNNDV